MTAALQRPERPSRVDVALDLAVLAALLIVIAVAATTLGLVAASVLLT